jgi:hypothetical protein
MPEKRGTVYIAPSGSDVPSGRMVDPDTSSFWVSWQEEGLADVIEWRDDIVGAEAAIAWGRERAAVVVIRLGHTGDTYFSAGDIADPSVPSWPPRTPPPEGSFTPRPDDG